MTNYFPFSFPQNKELESKVGNAAGILEKKFRELDYNSLPISVYGKKYYAYDLRKLRYMLVSYATMLAESIHRTEKTVNEITIIDHGAGVGMLSLLAKLTGVGTVIYQDLNPTIVNDAGRIAYNMNIDIDHYVSGDTQDFVEYCLKNDLCVDILCSRNVIEHIYDINDFIFQSGELPSEKLILCLSTTANMHNPLVNRFTRKIHRTYEEKGSPIEWGSKEYDASLSGIHIRERLIKEYFPDFSADVLRKLSILSRGKLRKQIVEEVVGFDSTGKYPLPIDDPTNTCDPDNGNWAEHLVPIKDYKKMAEENGFTFEYQCGFYNTNYPQKALNLVTPILNFFIRLFGKKGLFLAPFMTMILVKKN